MRCECIDEKEKLDIILLIEEEIRRQDIEMAKITERERNDIIKAASFVRPILKRKSDLSILKNSIQSIPLCKIPTISKYAETAPAPFVRVERP